jgi:hypothetical protein
MYRFAMSISAFLAGELADPGTQWSIGTFGALAEFIYEADETVRREDLSVLTARGAIRLTPNGETRPFAYETLTKSSWTGRVALCLPEDRCAMSGRTLLTEIGPDRDAIRREDRGAILFDLGIGAKHAEFYVRVADPDLARALRRCCGQSWLAPGAEAMHLILAASPHRVFVSKLGRIEVFQPIPPANGQSPMGPHTHVLPDLLHHRRTHAATEPVPAGWVPCAYLYPAHPTRDGFDRPRPYDPALHHKFEMLLRRYGDPESLALKKRVKEAVASGQDPTTIQNGRGRFARNEIRITLRQLEAARE